MRTWIKKKKMLWSLFPDSCKLQEKETLQILRLVFPSMVCRAKLVHTLQGLRWAMKKVHLQVQKPVGETAAKGNWVGQQAQMITIPSHKWTRRDLKIAHNTKSRTNKELHEILRRAKESRGEEVSFKSKDQMRPVFPPVIEIERARRCWHCTNNKRTQGLKSRTHQSLFDVGRVRLFCRFVEGPDREIRGWKRRRGDDTGRERMCERPRDEGSEDCKPNSFTSEWNHHLFITNWSYNSRKGPSWRTKAELFLHWELHPVFFNTSSKMKVKVRLIFTSLRKRKEKISEMKFRGFTRVWTVLQWSMVSTADVVV